MSASPHQQPNEQKARIDALKRELSSVEHKRSKLDAVITSYRQTINRLEAKLAFGELDRAGTSHE